MRAVLQRVSSAEVAVDGTVTGRIDHGFLILLGVGRGDTPDDASWLARKVAVVRVFPDEAGAMNRSVVEVAGGLLVVSQFTLYGSLRKGTRPSFNDAAAPDEARALYEHFVALLAEAAARPVATGVFGAMMQVSLVNDGPVTLLLDSRARD